MKNGAFKKMLSLLLTTAIVITLLPTAISAADATVAISDAKDSPGKTVKLQVTIDPNPTLADAIIWFDIPEELKLVNFDGTGGMMIDSSTDINEGKLMLREVALPIEEDENADPSGTDFPGWKEPLLTTLEIFIPNNTPSGNYSIGIIPFDDVSSASGIGSSFSYVTQSGDTEVIKSLENVTYESGTVTVVKYNDLTLTYFSNVPGVTPPAADSANIEEGKSHQFTVKGADGMLNEGYTFKGWATSSGAITPEYEPGETYETAVSAKLYAVWEKYAFTAPTSVFFDAKKTSSGGYSLPDPKNITVKNIGNRYIGDFSISAISGSSGLFNISPSTFSLDAGLESLVEVSLSEAAKSLSSGIYAAVYGISSQSQEISKEITFSFEVHDFGVELFTLTVNNGIGARDDVEPGTEVSIAANEAEEGQEFDVWMFTLSDNPYTPLFVSGSINSGEVSFKMPEGNVTATATYKNYYSVTVNGSGTVGSKQKVYPGETVEISAPYEITGEVFDKWEFTTSSSSYTPEFEDGNITANSVSFKMPEDNVTATAKYKKYYSVIVNNGSAIINGGSGSSGKVFQDDSVTITADVRPSEKFNKWTFTSSGGNYTPTFLSGSETSSSGATFNMPGWDVTITATYNPDAPDHPFSRGDVNRDGEIGNADALWLKRYLLELPGYTEFREEMDMNDNGEIGNDDALWLVRHLLELPGYLVIMPW
ncbi:MAG: dockerin type I domain-containing protein [Eubacterium sp.]|jgi:hypothetical protein|nr:dockerin type I domain-containing protein [Eubacterium sp.]